MSDVQLERGIELAWEPLLVDEECTTKRADEVSVTVVLAVVLPGAPFMGAAGFVEGAPAGLLGTALGGNDGATTRDGTLVALACDGTLDGMVAVTLLALVGKDGVLGGNLLPEALQSSWDRTASSVSMQTACKYKVWSVVRFATMIAMVSILAFGPSQQVEFALAMDRHKQAIVVNVAADCVCAWARVSL
jgi:hypothetical protein